MRLSVARAALAHSRAGPRQRFSLSQSAGNFMRFNVSQSLDRRIFATLHQCMRAQGCAA